MIADRVPDHGSAGVRASYLFLRWRLSAAIPIYTLSRMSRKVLAEGRPVVFYVHPREMEPGHPRLRMNPLRRFKSYVGVRSTEGKVRRLLQEFPVNHL